MEDNDVISAVNNEANSQKLSQKSTVSFIFSLKNRIGGLARALRVFQVCKIKIHIIYNLN